MASCAGVWNLVSVRHSRRDESESMASDVYVGDRLFDLGHVAGYAVVPRTTGFVMRVRFDRGCVRPVRRARAMAFQAYYVRGFYQQGIVFGPVNVMAA